MKYVYEFFVKGLAFWKPILHNSAVCSEHRRMSARSALEEIFMGKHRVYQIFAGIVWALMLAAEAAAFLLLWRTHMFPRTYLVMGLVLMGCIWLLTGVLLFYMGTRKGRLSRAIRRICGFLIAIVVCAGCLYGGHAAWSIRNTVDNVTRDENTVNRVSMMVYVPMDSEVVGLENLKDAAFSVPSSFELKNTQFALSQIAQVLGQEPRTQSYPTPAAMLRAMENGDTEAMVINQVYLDLLELVDEYSDLYERIRLIKEFEIEDLEDSHPTWIPEPVAPATGENGETRPVSDDTPAEVPTQEIVEVDTEDVDVTHDGFIIYLGGSDTRTSYLPERTRNDVNILMAVNPVTKKIQLVTTARDAYVPNPAGGGALDKLTHCGIYGVSNSVRALSSLYEVPISYFAQINFSGVETLVDAVGGVDVYSDLSYSALGTWIDEGWNHLNGAQALSFARERYNPAVGDAGRARNQMKVITAILNKATSGTTLLSNYSQILSSLSGMFRTDMSAEEIASLVRMQLTDMSGWDISSYSMSYSADWGVTYSMPGYELWIARPDYSDVAYIHDLLMNVINGN